MTGLDFVLDRSVTIVARRETVFRYFTDSERFAAWWGAGSRIDPAARGRRAHPLPERDRGRRAKCWRSFPPRRVVFSYGFESGQPIPIGASRVTITLEETRARHARAAPPRAAERRGARRARAGLALPARRVRQRGGAGRRTRARALSPTATSPAGARPTPSKRRAELAAVATDDLAFRDPYSCTSGIDDLNAHIAASQRFMPGVVLARRGEPRQCQGLALVDWVVQGPDGSERAKGTNVFELDGDGRIGRATGFWG